jgi:hypothetical protein
MSFTFSLLADFKSLFPEEEPLTVEEYVNGIDRNSLLRVGTSLIRRNPITTEFRDWRNLLRMWFRESNDDFYKKLWRQCELFSIRNRSEVSFNSPLAGLSFFEKVYSFPQTEITQTEEESEISLFKAYLIVLTESTQKETNSDVYLETFLTPDRLPLTLLNQQFPYSDFINYHLADSLICQIIKSVYLFEFLEQTANAKSLIHAFYAAYGVTSWKEYFQYIMPIISADTTKAESTYTDLVIEKNERFAKSCQFLDELTLSTIDSELNADFKMIRDNPLYKTEDGVYSIIYPLFVIDKVYKGLFFKFKDIFNAQQVKNLDSWNRLFTKDFAESFLLYNILEYIYEKRSYPRLTGDKMDELSGKKKGGIDYYIRSGKNILLFENKSVFINANIKHSGDFEQIYNALKSKFYFDDVKGKIKKKAVIQLVTNIRRVLNKENSFDDKYDASRVAIYPILMIQDSTFNTAGLNYLVNMWFETELKHLTDEGLDIKRVNKIAIINIDTLIMYSDYLRNKKMTLEDLIDEYLKRSVFNPRKPYKSKAEFEGAYANTFLPFSHFIDEYTDSGFRKTNQNFREQIFSRFQ